MNREYLVCCISHGRHEGVPEFVKMIGNCVFFVKDQQDKDNYEKAGATEVIVSGSLMDSRNAALDYCFTRGKICVQLSDDLQNIKLNDFTGKRTHVEVPFKEVMEYVMKNIGEEKYAGFSPTNNPFFALKEFERNKFIVGDFIVVQPTDLRFDAIIRLNEDYDYTLQHIKNEKGTLRFGKYLCHFKHYSNKGGAVSYRNTELEQETIRYLAEKWPGCINLNPKRENEILISKNAAEILSQESLF